MPPAAPPSGRALLVALALVLGAGGVLVRTGLAGGGAAPTVRALAPADTDSVRTPAEPARPDDSTAAARPDTTPGDTDRVRTYLRGLRAPVPYATLRGAPTPLLPPLGSYWRYETAIDSATGQYVLRERVGNLDVRLPVAVGFEDYREARRRQAVATTFRELLERRAHPCTLR